MSTNLAIIQGNIGNSIDLKSTQSGTSVCNLNIATNRHWTQNGQKQQETDWHRVVVFGKTAEACAEYLSKGDPVVVRGRIQSREWTDNSGIERTTTEIVAQNVDFINGVATSGRGGGQKTGPEESFDENDIPF